jgi:negative regulator of sigma E activity
MRITTIFVIAVLCSAALAANKADTCLYDQVSQMSAAGQKLAYQLTRTQVDVTFATSSHVVYEKPTVENIETTEVVHGGFHTTTHW